jgi:hypothetical protein
MTRVSSGQRFRHDRPCPICGGYDEQARGKGIRCHGYRGDDPQVVYCARAEHAGRLPPDRNGLFRHVLRDGCGCGIPHPPAPSKGGKGGRGGIPPKRETTTTQQPLSGCTLAQYAAAKRLPLEFLRTLGLRDMSYLGAPAVRIPYLDPSGLEVAVRFRVAVTSTEAGACFRWRTGSPLCLYGLWRLADAASVVIAEGESDPQTLWFHGISAVGLPGASTWREDWAAALKAIPLVYVVIEPDRGGAAVEHWLATSTLRHRARLVRLDGAKDPSALYLADPEQFRERWAAALAAATPWADEAARARRAETEAAWLQCAALAAEPRILDRFAKDLRDWGIVGEERPAKLLFLAIVSRHLPPRPVSATVRGPSSAGKSYVTDRVLGFFPGSAAYCLSAMSERALAYADEPLQHRMLVLYESAGLKGDFVQYLIRSLISEGRLRYLTVEKTPQGLRPKLIEREGPTGLIMTTTAIALDAEMETRILSVPVTDTQEQTQEVLGELARERVTAVDMAPWHALAVWLGGSESRVTIPFSRVLAKLIPPVAVRLRRDFGAVLALTRAHAFLHQVTRARTPEGAIVATLDDYAAIRGLVHDLVAEAIGATVAPAIRETVETVATLVRDPTQAGEVTVTAVAKALRLDKSTAWRRVHVALERGFLKNLEDRKGRPARLAMGDPLPVEEAILPAADDPRLRGWYDFTEWKDDPPSPNSPNSPGDPGWVTGAEPDP